MAFVCTRNMMRLKGICKNEKNEEKKKKRQGRGKKKKEDHCCKFNEQNRSALPRSICFSPWETADLDRA